MGMAVRGRLGWRMMWGKWQRDVGIRGDGMEGNGGIGEDGMEGGVGMRGGWDGGSGMVGAQMGGDGMEGDVGTERLGWGDMGW